MKPPVQAASTPSVGEVNSRIRVSALLFTLRGPLCCGASYRMTYLLPRRLVQCSLLPWTQLLRGDLRHSAAQSYCAIYCRSASYCVAYSCGAIATARSTAAVPATAWPTATGPKLLRDLLPQRQLLHGLLLLHCQSCCKGLTTAAPATAWPNATGPVLLQYLLPQRQLPHDTTD